MGSVDGNREISMLCGSFPVNPSLYTCTLYKFMANAVLSLWPSQRQVQPAE